MILKLFNLNKSKLEQNVILKQKTKNKINDINEKIKEIQNELNTCGVDKYGAISDFKLLAMHKDTLKYNKIDLISKINTLKQDLKKYDIIIMNYQKEIEKYKYILNEEKKLKIKKIEKYEENIANEYVQSQYIKNMNNRK